MSNPEQVSKIQQIKEREVYVGPRPFERSERGLFFGRDREISELLSLVISSRIVLCYAPSGAGKTSLINAGLEPRLEKEGFDVFPSTRVRGLIPAGIDQEKIVNIYMFNALLSLAGKSGTPAELANCTLEEHLSKHPYLTDEDGFPAPRILILDQFEELLTSYPERWHERDGFFRQVHDALQKDPLLRILFIMREDFLARIEPFMRLLKPFPHARFRLDLLGPEGARAAVIGPLRETGKRFKEGVVNALIEELQKVRVETNQGEAVDVVGEYVEPVQLQVVCRNLWTGLPPDVQEISQEHLKAYGDVSHALRDFYETCLAEAKASLGANQLNVRQWFEHQLITPAGTRGIVFRDAERTADLPNHVVDFLENRHLIRGEWRAGSRWYELTHDRFIEPIQRANEHWRAQRQAHRIKLAMTVVIPVVLAMFVFAGIFSTRSYSSQSANNKTAVAGTVVVVEANAQATAQVQADVAQVQVQVAQEDVALSKSRQLAAEALLLDDPDLSLLLAVQANRYKDTQEARKSLHKILSRQAIIDGEFLSEYNPEIVSPSLVKRLDDHKNWVESVAFSPDGSRFVSGSADGTLILWDVATVKPVPLAVVNSTVMSVTFSPDGKLIAAATVNEQVLLWDASNGQPVGGPLLRHSGMVTCVAFSPDGTRLASGGEDNTVRIWDLSTRQSQEVSQPAEVWSVAWSPDGKTLAVAGAGSFVRLFDTGTFSKVSVLKGHNGLVRTLAWSPDGRILASGSASKEGEPAHGEVILWNPVSGELTDRLQFNNSQPVRTVAFDPGGKTLAIGQDNGTITFVDASSKQPLGNPIKAHNHRVMSIAFSPDGQYMISGSIDKTIGLWDLFTPTRSIVIDPTGELLATSQGAAISLWDMSATDSTIPVKILYGHTDDILALVFSPDGSILASAGRDDTILLWDVSSGGQFGHPLIGHSGDVLTLDISPDASTLASAGEDGTVLLWDIASQKQYNQLFTGINGALIKILFGEGGKTLQVAGKDGSLAILDLESGKNQLEVLPATQGGVASLALSRDGQRAAYFQEAETAFLEDDKRAHGIAISMWDSSIDPTVNPADVDFIVVKATEGNFVDRNFEEYSQLIQQVPMRGAMHFFRGDVPWQEQADFFLSTVKDKGFHFYTLDLEPTSERGSTTFLFDAEQWLTYVDERVEQKVLLQTGPSYMNSFGIDGNWMKEWPLLIMQYPLEPDRNGSPVLPTGVTDWKIWNYSEGRGMGTEYGVGGNDVYLEVYNGTPSDMWGWLEITSFSIFDRPSGNLTRLKRAIQVTGLNGIAFSPDSSYIAYAGEGKVSLLNAGSGEEISTLFLGGRTILSLNFADDSKLSIGTEDGTVLLWDLGLLDVGTELEPYLVSTCSAAVKRNFSSDEWLQYIGDSPYQKSCSNLP